jgi:PhzF family phenazine biosynthesis protein
MQLRPFKQVDVFTATPYYGNPLAVVLDGAGLSDAQMQHFAHWTNLSETTFVLPPTPEGAAKGADYRVRIFTPGAELPFAGHPTLGSCHGWLEAGGQPRTQGHIVQECGVGLVQIHHDGGQLAFAAPALTRSAPSPSQLALIAQALGLKSQQIIAAQLLDNGPVWLGLLLDSVQTVLGLQPDHLALKNLGVKVGVVAVEDAPEAAPALIARSNRESRAFVHTDGPSVEVRAFAAPVGVIEDPVTGSLNASLAQWLMADGYAPLTYTASQGTCLDRAGRVQLSRDATGQVWVGGDAVTCITGTVRL